MPLPHDLCSQVQNGFRLRRASIAVPHTTQNLAILGILLREGFLSSITRGTASVPSPSEWALVTEPYRRIWASLKYRGDRPVLSSMSLISAPSKRIHMDAYGIRRLVSGKRSSFVKPLGMGEIAIVKVGDKQWVEAREAVAMDLGGEVVCRAR